MLLVTEVTTTIRHRDVVSVAGVPLTLVNGSSAPGAGSAIVAVAVPRVVVRGRRSVRLDMAENGRSAVVVITKGRKAVAGP